MKKLILSLSALAIVSTIVLVACSKDNNDSGSTTLKVKLTDRPGAYDEVNVDIQEVRVNYRSDTTDWASFGTNAGIYDLLTLQNGIDTVLATGVVPTNSVKQIRFILGPNNTIKVGGVVYPLTVPSGSESGLKLMINKQLTGQLDSLIIDFDAALSIHQLGNGTYQLKPVLRVK